MYQFLELNGLDPNKQVLTDEELFGLDGRLISVESSTNTHGQFLFVTMRFPEETITFWGAGYNWNSGRYVENAWQFYTACRTDFEETDIDVREAAQRHLNDMRMLYGENEQTSEQRAFDFISHLTDADGALTELEDNPHIADLFE